MGDIFQRNNFPIPERPARRVDVHIGERKFSFDTATLDSLPRAEMVMVLECAGNGRSFMEPTTDGIQWEMGGVSPVSFGGARLVDVIGPIPEEVKELVFTGSDHGVVDPDGEIHYEFSITEELWELSILATRLGDSPLPLEHGGPIRLVVPGQYAMKSVKWVRSITGVAEPFHGHFVEKYRYFGDSEVPEGAAVGDIQVRSLISNPADNTTLSAGAVTIRGSAWSTISDLQAVEISIDDGENWSEASLHAPDSPYAPATWDRQEDLEPGIYVVAARAIDSRGRSQPSEPRWNRNGYGNNMTHRITVTVV